MDKKSLIVACVPAFNEEKTIARVVLLAQRYADKVIVCDDGSLDLTAEIAEGLGAEVVRHGRRLGYGWRSRCWHISFTKVSTCIEAKSLCVALSF